MPVILRSFAGSKLHNDRKYRTGEATKNPNGNRQNSFFKGINPLKNI
jgi:hypothetical protein